MSAHDRDDTKYSDLLDFLEKNKTHEKDMMTDIAKAITTHSDKDDNNNPVNLGLTEAAIRKAAHDWASHYPYDRDQHDRIPIAGAWSL